MNSPCLFRKTEKVNKILAQSTEPCSFIITEDKPGASSCNWQRTQLLTDTCCSYLPYPHPSTENSVTAATKQELWYGSSSMSAPETAATAPIQLSLQSSSHSSKPSAPGLFLTTSSKPCCFPFCFWVQEQIVNLSTRTDSQGLAKTEVCLCFWGVLSWLYELLFTITSAINVLLGLSMNLCTAKPQNGLWLHVPTPVIMIHLWMAQYTVLTNTPSPIAYLGKDRYRRWGRITHSK